ncbi:hypothetical protein SAMN05216383_13210 [Prevotella sp. KH2C16]|nr:hypothetical protein SAMN05216383_13210 [Prevotella sp. KH2C16]
MENQDLKGMSASKAAPNDRMLTGIPKQDIGCHYSSLTDYLDKAVGYNPKMLSTIDDLIMQFHLGAVTKQVNGHHGTVLPRISRNDKVVGGSVLYFDTGSGAVLQREALVEHLYSWYCFSYYVDSEVFFGEHLLSNKPVAIVQEEKTALLGTLAEPTVDWLAVGEGSNLTKGMMSKLAGRRVVLFPDDMSCDYWTEQFGKQFKVDCGFVNRDINRYLIDTIRGRGSP